MTAIRLVDAGVSFEMGRSESFWGVRRVTLEVQKGEVLGVIGPNGAGKSTLLRLIAGIYPPDEGQRFVTGRVAPLLSFSAGLKPDLTGWDNIDLSGVLLGLPRRVVAERKRAIADFSGLGKFIEQKARTYSTGMRARLGFAIAVHVDADIFVLDEVLSVGDKAFREHGEERMNELISSGKTFVIASHRLEQLADVCDRLVYLENGRVAAAGPAPEMIARYESSPVVQMGDRV
jgi:ABC-type polysaccharide/polyol phosphate transport system ATPase subunit